MTTKNNAKVANATKGRQRIIDRRQHHPIGTERSTSETGNKTLRFVLDSDNRLTEEENGGGGGGGGGGKSAPNLCARAIVDVELSNRSSGDVVESSLAVSPDGTIAHLRTHPAAWARQSLCDLLYERATNLLSRIVVSASRGGGGGGATAFGAGASSPLQTVYRVSQLLVAISPDVAAYRTLTADVHMARGDLQDALREWGHCLRVAPDDSSALAKSALCYAVQGKATIAVDRLVKLVSGGNIDQLVEDVVRSMTSDERESVAREALKRVDWRAPSSLSFSTLAVVATQREKPGPLRMRATHLGALGRHAEARDELTLCLKLVGENAGDLCGRACLFSVEGSLEKARKDFLRAFELDARLSVGLLASGPAQDAFRRAFFVRDDGNDVDGVPDR